MPKTDLFFWDHGSVWTVDVATKRALKWVRENVEIPSWAGCEKHFVGDWRPLRDLAEGAEASGLIVVRG